MNSFQIIRPADFAACLSHPSKVVETAKGRIEYAERGEGHVLVVVHGGPGGYDQGLGLGELCRLNGYKVISFSRPGYLRTPLDTGSTFEEQADALAALTDALELDKTLVLGASAGGPASYLFAARHPAKVRALIEVDSVTIKYQVNVSLLQEKFLLSKTGLWLLNFSVNHFPETAVKSFLQVASTLDQRALIETAKHIANDENKLAAMKFLFAVMFKKYEERQAGLDNDLKQMFAIDHLPLDTITCPVLIMHGTADKDVTPAHAEYAHSVIRGADLYWIKNGSHTGFFTADSACEAQEYVLDWMKTHCS